MPSGVVALLLLAASSLLFFLGATAMLRLPDVYTRTNVLSKALALGMAGLVGALLLRGPGWVESSKLLLVWVIVYVTGMFLRRWLERMALSKKVPPWEL